MTLVDSGGVGYLSHYLFSQIFSLFWFERFIAFCFEQTINLFVGFGNFSGAKIVSSSTLFKEAHILFELFQLGWVVFESFFGVLD